MTTGVEAFDSTVQKTNQLLKGIAGELGDDDVRHSYQLLRAFLHTLRDRMPVNEAVHFGAQLPMLVRGFYYEGWKPGSVPLKIHREEFMQGIRRQLPFNTDKTMQELIAVVVRQLAGYVEPSALQKIIKTMPEDIAGLLDK